MRYTLTLLLLILILAPIKAQEFYELKKFIISGVDQEKDWTITWKTPIYRLQKKQEFRR